MNEVPWSIGPQIKEIDIALENVTNIIIPNKFIKELTFNESTHHIELELTNLDSEEGKALRCKGCDDECGVERIALDNDIMYIDINYTDNSTKRIHPDYERDSAYDNILQSSVMTKESIKITILGEDELL